MRKKIGFIFMGIGAVLVVAALALLLFNRAEDKNAGNAADEILPAVMAAIEEPLPTGDENGEDEPETAYEVTEVEELQPTEIGQMLESGYDLTLYTCTYGGQSRVTVRCSRADSS